MPAPHRSIPVGVALCLALYAAAPQETRAEDPPLPTLEEITQHLDDLYRSESSHATIRMEVTTKHFSRTLVIESWSVGEDRALMLIRKPAREAGTATLKKGEDLWNYAPRADRLVRIPSGMLSENWMGSHFTNDDLVRDSSFEKDYDTSLKWVTIDGKRRLEVVFIPHEDTPVVHTRIVQIVDPEGWLPIRVDFYDGKEIVRTMHYRDVKVLGGKRIPSVLEVIPTDKPSESTRVVYESMTFDGAVDASLFTPRGLRKLAKRR